MINIQPLATEHFKMRNNLSVTIMNDFFQPRAISYNLRSQIDFKGNSKHFRITSLRHMGAKM